jgi:UDP-glucose 4-epimerase
LKKVLVLGGTGFLGMNLCCQLYNNGIKIKVYSRGKGYYEYMKKIYTEIEYVCGEFSFESEFEQLVDDVDIIFHLISSTRPSNMMMIKEFNDNVIPTVKLLDACVLKKKKVIYFSSGGTVYGNPRYIPIDEYHRTDPISPYGIQKLTTEKIIEYYGRTFGLDYRILRISNPYGQFQSPNSNQGIIAVFLSRVLSDKYIEVWGDGSNIRDYIYVDDLIDACIRVMNYNGKERIFNISSGIGYSIMELIDVIKRNVSNTIELKILEARVQDVSTNILSNKIAQLELDWSPSWSLDKGVKDMIDMWNNEKNIFMRNNL